MDALKAFGHDGLDPQQPRALGRPVAGGAGAVLLACNHDQGRGTGLILHGGIVDG